MLKSGLSALREPVSEPVKIEFFKLGRSRGVQAERTDHTKTFRRTLAGFGLAWDQKVHFSTFDRNWNFNVLEMAFKALGFVQGLSRTPLLFISRYLTNICFIFSPNNRKSRNLKT